MGWAALGRGSAQIGSFVLSAVLARLLTPADFGLMAMATVLTAFAALFMELGFGAALVQARTINETHRSSIFWVNTAAGVLLTGLTIGVAPLAAAFFSEPKLTALIIAISPTFLILSLGVVQRAVLTRAMRFRAIAAIEVSATWTAGLLAITAAVNGFGVWSLVVQSLTSALFATGLHWLFARWRPTLRFRYASVKELLRFSVNLLGFNVFNYWIRNIDSLLIGKFLGPALLGFYSRAYAIMMLPMGQITAVLGRVMFPTLSRIQDDPQRVKKAYLRALSAVAFVSFPLMLGLAAVSDDFVRTVYGEQWMRSAGLLRILCFVGALQSVESSVGWIFRSQGRTDVLLRWGIAAGSLLIGSICFGVWIGTIEAVALCYAIGGALLFYPNFSVPGAFIGLRVREVIWAIWRPALGACVMAAIVALLGAALANWSASWIRLMLGIGTGSTVYLLLARSLDKRVFEEIRGIVLQRAAGVLRKQRKA